MQNHTGNMKVGIIAGISTYIMWGSLPLYWKLAADVPALEVLAYRIVCSFIFMVIVIAILGKNKAITDEIRRVLGHRKTTFAIIAASVLITANWFIFIFAVSANHVLSASLGYYINPLVNVLLALIFLKEKLKYSEIAAVLFAAAGVIILAWSQGSFPWAAISLAVTMGLYGLIKKVVPVSAWAGLTLETMLITPAALIYLLFFASQPVMSYSFNLNLVLSGTGIITAIPLLLFAVSAKNIPYTMLGFLQYIGPTLMLAIAVLVYNETFNKIQFTAFIFIWCALIIFTMSNFFISAKTKSMSRHSAS